MEDTQNFREDGRKMTQFDIQQNSETIQDADFSVPAISTEQEKMLARFNLPLAVIEGLKQKYMGLKISDPKDRKGYEVVQAARMEVKAHRIQVEKGHKELKEAALKYGRLCDWGKNFLIAAIDPLEEYLDSEKKRIDDEIQAEKDRRQNEINERVARRVEALTAVNALPSIRYEDLPGMDESDFQAHLSVATQKWNEEQKAKAEAEAELSRLRKAEEERRVKEQAEMEAKAKEQAAREAVLQAKEAALKAAQDKVEAERLAIEEGKRKEAEAKARAEELERAKAQAAEEATRKAEAEAKRKADAETARIEQASKEAELRAAQATEIEKLEQFLFDIRGVKIPVIRDAKLQGVLVSFTNQIVAFDKAIQAAK